MTLNVGGDFCKSFCSGDIYLIFSPLQDNSGSTLTMTDVSVSDSGNISSSFPKKLPTVLFHCKVFKMGG